jgi:hypothetical protein
MRFICELEHLKRMAKCLEENVGQIDLMLSDGKYLTLAARMLGHSDFDDFQMSLEMPDRTDRLLYIEEGRRADMDPLLECHRLALVAAGFRIDDAEELAVALMANEQWIREVLPLPLTLTYMEE